MIQFLIFGALGIFGTVLFGSVKKTASSRSLELTAEASLALFPVFGLIAFVYPMIAIHTGKMSWYARGIFYMLSFYTAQLIIGMALNKINMCPWKYTGKDSLMGLIRLSDAPIWFASGLAVEWIYPYVKLAVNAM